MSVLNNVTKKINEYLNTLTVKPKLIYGNTEVSEGLYLINVDIDNETNISYDSTVALSLKWKETKGNRGLFEAEEWITNLKNYLEKNGNVYDCKMRYIGKDKDLYIYNLMFRIVTTK